MLLFDPQGRIAICTESARITDSVFLIMRNDQDYFYEDGEGKIVVFRTENHAARIRKKIKGDWGIYEFYPVDCVLLLSRPHVCVGEEYDMHRVPSPETE